MTYPDIPSAIRPVAHSDEIPVPVFAGLNEINDDVISTTTSNTDEDEATDFFSHLMQIVICLSCLVRLN